LQGVIYSFALGVESMFIAMPLVGAVTLCLAIAADTGSSLLVAFNGLVGC
jgi:cation transport ATPase